MTLIFKPAHLLPWNSAAVMAALATLSQHLDWVKYEEIRQRIRPERIPGGAAGKRAILSALEQLERDGYVRRKDHLWGFTPEYQAWSQK